MVSIKQFCIESKERIITNDFFKPVIYMSISLILSAILAIALAFAFQPII